MLLKTETDITLRHTLSGSQGSAYDTAPAMGTQLGTSGTFSAGWTTVDVNSYIARNGSYNFAFSTASSNTANQPS